MSERCSAWVPTPESHDVHQCKHLASGEFGGERFCSRHVDALGRKVDDDNPPERIAALYLFDAERMKPTPRAEVPTMPQLFKWTLYRMYDADDQLLYIGISGRGARRFTEHRGAKAWWTNVATIKVEHYAFAGQAEQAETEAIWAEAPLHNVRHNSPAVRDMSGMAGS